MKKRCISSLTILLASYTILAVYGCKSKPQDDKHTVLKTPTQETIADVNRYLSEKDKAVIEGYGRRNQLNLTISESGFYYEIFDIGKGKNITQNSVVSLTGTLSLIDGTPCYVYSKEEPKLIAISKSPEVAGLHIALPMLKENGRAVFIFPPNLAFGLLGDGSKVPPRSIIVMNVSIVKVQE